MSTKIKKTRNWANEETNLFVDILVDEEHNFADFLERRALKRSASEEVYSEILKLFNLKLKEDFFIELNKKNSGKDKYEHLVVDTKKTSSEIQLFEEKMERN